MVSSYLIHVIIN